MIAFSKTYSKGKLWLSLVLCLWTFHITFLIVQFSSVELLSHVRLFVTPWIAAHQASLSITNSQSSPKLMSKSVMPTSHLILYLPLLLLPPIPPSIRVFSNESTLRMRGYVCLFQSWFPQGIMTRSGISGSYGHFIPSFFKESSYHLP